jgi:cysteine-rich repeat protein
VEPSCASGPCTSACGDGLILPSDNEECDDGNATDGDGCSSTCTIEPGFTCTNVSGSLPPTLDVPVAYRDFVALPQASVPKHPDFNSYGGSTQTPGLVANQLGVDGKPVYTGICEASLIGPCPYGQQTTTQADFDQWYRDVAGVNIKHVALLSLAQQPNGTYYFPDATFFPLDNLGWMASGDDAPFAGHNFGFTTEIRTWFGSSSRAERRSTSRATTTCGCSSTRASRSTSAASTRRCRARSCSTRPPPRT